MAQAVVGDATLKCSFGTATASLTIAASKVSVGGSPVGTIMDAAPGANVAGFGSCTSMSNPQVAAATASPPPGVLKPQPCIPMLPGKPWSGCESKVTWSGMPPLTTDGCLNCAYGGVITIVSAGQSTVMI